MSQRFKVIMGSTPLTVRRREEEETVSRTAEGFGVRREENRDNKEGRMCGSECFARLILLSFKEFNQLAPPCSPCTTKHPTWTHTNNQPRPHYAAGSSRRWGSLLLLSLCSEMPPVFESSWSLKCARSAQVSTTDSRFKIWQKQEVTDASRPLKNVMK